MMLSRSSLMYMILLSFFSEGATKGVGAARGEGLGNGATYATKGIEGTTTGVTQSIDRYTKGSQGTVSSS